MQRAEVPIPSGHRVKRECSEQRFPYLLATEREEAVEQEGEAERELVEERGRTTEQEDKEGRSTTTGREGATGRAAAEEGAKAAERKGATGREGATERGALRHVYLESLLQDALEAKGYRSPTWRILRALQATINANVVIGETRLTAAPFFEGAGRPSVPFLDLSKGEE